MTDGTSKRGGAFPSTRHTLVAEAAVIDVSRRRAAFDTLTGVYWRPAYKYVRLKWRAAPEDAEDLIQGFFSRAFEKRLFDRFDPSRARFRTYLRLCLDGYVQNAHKAARRLKRGGPARLLPLDFEGAERELGEIAVERMRDEDAFFQQEWIRTVFSTAVARMRDVLIGSGRTVRFELFRRYDLEASDGARPSQAALASEFGMSPHDVTNNLSAARREFRRIALDTLRDLCATEEEFRTEARDLFGGLTKPQKPT
jgi:RNA polymerase sigma factor (sigma-70 family)